MINEYEIKKWITFNPICIDKNISLIHTIKTMALKNIGAILITDAEKLIGIFSERDLVKIFSSPKNHFLKIFHAPIQEFMTKDPICAQLNEDYHSVYIKMSTHNIRHIPILNGDKIAGIVSIRDLTRCYQNKIESEFIEAKNDITKYKELLNLSENQKINTLINEVNKFKELSLTDYLTGLYNKRFFLQRLNEEILRTKRSNHSFSLIFCDIDHFKQVNDRYGHQAGDKVLMEIAKILAGQLDELNVLARLRKSDIVARYGGEEFVIILPETKANKALSLAEEIRIAIESRVFKVEKNKLKITMSFGIAEFNPNRNDADELIKQADYAMYEAKKKGRNRIEIFNDKLLTYL